MNIRILSLSNLAIELIDNATNGTAWRACSVASDADNCRDVCLSDSAQIRIDGNQLHILFCGVDVPIYSYQFFKI